jgi:hypothetical protein
MFKRAWCWIAHAKHHSWSEKGLHHYSVICTRCLTAFDVYDG